MSIWQNLYHWSRRLLDPYYYPSRRTVTSYTPELRGLWLDLRLYQIVGLDKLSRIATITSLHPHFHYYHFTKAKKDGTKRQLAEPDPMLKKFQRHILRYYLNQLAPHPSAIGFRRRKSIADHVWAHAGAPFIITADIQDFFPNTKTWRVADWWQTQFESEDIAQFLTLLTTYRNSLPQGAPTSPALSNHVNHEMDSRLEQRARQINGRYTRYCDDMAFSFYARPPADFEAGVRSTLHANGYDLHRWRLYNREDEPIITGVKLKRDGTVVIPDDMRHRMRKLRRSHDIARLTGYESYQQMIERP